LSLTNVPLILVIILLLRNSQAIGETFIVRLMITEIESEKTSSIPLQIKDSFFQSISLQAYLDSDKKTELTTYYKYLKHRSKAIQTTNLDIYRTELLAKHQLINLLIYLKVPFCISIH
jgi:hypothetical protein